MDSGAWGGYSPWGSQESWTQLNMCTFTFRWFKNTELQVGGAVSQGSQKSLPGPEQGALKPRFDCRLP